jgi:predicted DNA-binding protein (MmcQ/YjbR family)
MSNYNSLKNKVTQIPKVTTRSMFGYQCYSISGKVFVGFNNKNDWQVIIRLPKDEQQIAIKTKGIKPFSHGVKAGWIEIDMNCVPLSTALKLVKKGHKYARTLKK